MISAMHNMMRRHVVGSAEELMGAGTYGMLYNAVGWGYVLAWGISFYPQLILNWKRKSTAGMSIGFQWYNLLGFLLYLIYTSFAPDAVVQDQMFAGHALVITAFQLAQVPLYGVNKLGDFPQLHGKMIGGLLILLDICLMLNVAKLMSSMDLLFACGYFKTAISLIKYTPQLYLNWLRKSTEGFAMGMVFLDLTGGTLSMAQQFISCAYDDATTTVRPEWTWEPFSGNKPKLLLAMIAIAYDCAFLYQHFVMYPPAPLEDIPAIPGQCSVERQRSDEVPLAAEGRPAKAD